MKPYRLNYPRFGVTVLIGGALAACAYAVRPSGIVCRVDVAPGIRMKMSRDAICARLSARLGESRAASPRDRITVTLTFMSDAVVTARMIRQSRPAAHVFDPISIQTHDRAINAIEIDQLAEALLDLLNEG